MAKRKPKPKPETQQTEAAKFGTTPANIVKKLLKAAKKTKEQTRSISGEFGQMVANAVEHDYLHRKAFSICKQLDQMPDEKLAECMTHLEYYLDVGGINARVEKVGRLDLGDQPGEEAETEPDESNVVSLQSAAE